MKIFTREALEALNMDEMQIEAILKQQNTTEEAMKAIGESENREQADKPVTVVNNITAFPTLDESKITSIADIKKYAQGSIIPNSLINQATQLFQKGAGSLGKDNTISDMYDIMETICDAALVSPSYSEIKEAGLNLTDEQMMAIFSYTQQGVKALEQFR